MWNGPGIERKEEVFRQRLRELGYADGQNTVIEWRFSQGVSERHLKFAAEFVRLNVDCIVANGANTIGVALKATKTIPIVMANIDADPVALGYIASLARPGGNVMGFTAIAHELAGKRIELLKDLVPNATRVAVLALATGAAARAHLEGATAVAHKLGMQVQLLEPRGPDELDHHGAGGSDRQMKIKRRTFLLAATTWPFAAIAQQPKKIYRVGYLSGRSGLERQDEAFRQWLRELGYVEGKNLVVEWRFNRGQNERNSEFVAEMIRLKVDCIAAGGVNLTRAA